MKKLQKDQKFCFSEILNYGTLHKFKPHTAMPRFNNMPSLLLVAASVTAITTATTPIRGVSPDLQPTYMNSHVECMGTITEYGTSVTIQATINDDYCDCQDGTNFFFYIFLFLYFFLYISQIIATRGDKNKYKVL